MNSIPTAFQVAPIRHLVRTVPASSDEEFSVFGTALYIKEAEYPVEVAFDGGDFSPWDLAIGVNFQRYNYAFKSIRIKNTVAAPNRVEFYAGFFDIDDKRLNIVESRNGSAASKVPSGLTETEHAFVSDVPVQILPADLNRAEVWLATPNLGEVFWGPSYDILNGPTGDNPFRAVGVSLDGYTKLTTKAAIWAKGSAGKYIYATVFSF